MSRSCRSSKSSKRSAGSPPASNSFLASPTLMGDDNATPVPTQTGWNGRVPPGRSPAGPRPRPALPFPGLLFLPIGLPPPRATLAILRGPRRTARPCGPGRGRIAPAGEGRPAGIPAVPGPTSPHLPGGQDMTTKITRDALEGYLNADFREALGPLGAFLGMLPVVSLPVSPGAAATGMRTR